MSFYYFRRRVCSPTISKINAKRSKEIAQGDNYANISHLVTGMRSTVERMDRRGQDQVIQLKTVLSEAKDFKEKVEFLASMPLENPSRSKESIAFYPAETEEELESLLEKNQVGTVMCFCCHMSTLFTYDNLPQRSGAAPNHERGWVEMACQLLT